MGELLAPRLEGTVGVGSKRRLGFAEFGPAGGRPVFWLHGTPGARRQIPQEARTLAAELDIRLIGIDRPGIGLSTQHRYESFRAFADDLEVVADCFGLDRFSVIGMSGGGPYALGTAAAMADRVAAVGVLGGVAPTKGSDAVEGGLVALGARFSPLIRRAQLPLGMALAGGVRVVRPLASPALDLYARFSPPGDRALLARPEFKAMFLDDLLNGSRRQLSAPLADVLLFASHWGFELSDIQAPVRWWHGDADHIVPHAHGRHVVDRLRDGELITLPGESHLGSLARTESVLSVLGDLW